LMGKLRSTQIARGNFHVMLGFRLYYKFCPQL
jgi:hypothetical protein